MPYYMTKKVYFIPTFVEKKISTNKADILQSL